MGSRGRRWSRGALVVAGLSLVACTPPDADRAPPFAVHTPAGKEVPEAEIAGTLTLEMGCLLVSGHPLVLPDGAAFDADAGSLTVGGTTFDVGESVRWGGAYRDAAPSDALPTGCPPGELAVAYTFAVGE